MSENEQSWTGAPDLPDAELRQLAMDFCDGKVYTSGMIPKGMRLSEVFLIMQLLSEEHFTALANNPPGIVYEYYDKAMPLGVNGQPMFLSARFVSTHDLPILHKMVDEIILMRKMFLAGDK